VGKPREGEIRGLKGKFEKVTEADPVGWMSEGKENDYKVPQRSNNQAVMGVEKKTGTTNYLRGRGVNSKKLASV